MNFPAVRFVQGFKRGISPPSQPVEKSVGLDAQRSCALATARIAERSKSSQLRIVKLQVNATEYAANA